jgi:hypothetical protein
MAIFGAGSKWNNVDEKKKYFFDNDIFEIGWNYSIAKDLYVATGSLKVGDIIYLKGNPPGSRTIRVKGIGIVINNFTDYLFNDEFKDLTPGLTKKLAIKVRWVVKTEFKINIPLTEGKLTNIRAATFYEEYLPSVNSAIINKLLSNIL